MKRLAPLIMFFALLSAFAFWWYSPQQILKRRTNILLHTLTLEPKDGKAVRQMGVYSFSALLANDIELISPSTTEANGIFPRSEMESTYSFFCEHAKECQFKLIKYESVNIKGQEANVTMKVKALVEFSSGRPVDGEYRVTLDWQHGDAGWLINRAEWDQVK